MPDDEGIQVSIMKWNISLGTSTADSQLKQVTLPKRTVAGRFWYIKQVNFRNGLRPWRQECKLESPNVTLSILAQRIQQTQTIRATVAYLQFQMYVPGYAF